MRSLFRAALYAASAGILAGSAISLPAAAQDAIERPMAGAPYWDSSLPTEQRVEDLLARMTMAEKLAQMISVWAGKTEI
ncbi:beta-glucosidase [Altererythrobacter atlanticus]|uniref:Uncharacterized protein n=1 Tax=Croceibacterium atlanticum TaxID=1267766 RepID=A0A0F7KS09_9SPHN|nr:hypothetical protein WYH_02210 [Croceibacterium atlanticum]MBB5732051.1 beta-glucosidase [Croceibacterium atlanticum]